MNFWSWHNFQTLKSCQGQPIVKWWPLKIDMYSTYTYKSYNHKLDTSNIIFLYDISQPYVFLFIYSNCIFELTIILEWLISLNSWNPWKILNLSIYSQITWSFDQFWTIACAIPYKYLTRNTEPKLEHPKNLLKWAQD